MITGDGQPRFPILSKLMMGLLSIPASNADSEHGFSMLRKIHTDQRSNLSQSTIIALMLVMFNCENYCVDSELPEALIKDCKKATTLAVKKTVMMKMISIKMGVVLLKLGMVRPFFFPVGKVHWGVPTLPSKSWELCTGYCREVHLTETTWVHSIWVIAKRLPW